MFGYFDACVHGSLGFSSSTNSSRVYPRCRRSLDWHRLAIGGLYRSDCNPQFRPGWLERTTMPVFAPPGSLPIPHPTAIPWTVSSRTSDSLGLQTRLY